MSREKKTEELMEEKNSNKDKDKDKRREGQNINIETLNVQRRRQTCKERNGCGRMKSNLLREKIKENE